MKSLRFCMVTTFYPPWGFGGDGIAVQNLSRALVADGHSVTVLHNVDAFRTVARDADASALPDSRKRMTMESRSSRYRPLGRWRRACRRIRLVGQRVTATQSVACSIVDSTSYISTTFH